MKYLLLLLLFVGGHCGGKMIRHGRSGPINYDMPAIPDMTSTVGYHGYYRREHLSLPAIPPMQVMGSGMSLMPSMSGLSRGYHYGQNIGLSEEGDGEYVRLPSLSYNYGGSGGGSGGQGSVMSDSVSSGYFPGEHRSTFHYRHYRRPTVYNYPPSYVGYNYRFGFPGFSITGKSGDDSMSGATADEMLANGEAEAAVEGEALTAAMTNGP